MLGFKSVEAAQGTLVVIELMPMIRKRPLEGGAEQGLAAAEQVHALAASSSPDRGSCTPAQNLRQSPLSYLVIGGRPP
jgi:hypothetical protein